MGRHTASSRRRPESRGPARLPLLAWGLFAAAVAGLCGPLLGLSLPTALGLSATTAAAFVAMWAASLWASRSGPRNDKLR
ncbi:hypothetical protein IW252_002636 [Zhihengliuella flava]|uniref:Uncharacterized protein n=1 Tax=Zhihengliuella flava TaxID=1285193 RepID=A0A931DBJ7_9MICC|nr:hypothetical protein [Zhihengliuella flava]